MSTQPAQSADTRLVGRTALVTGGNTGIGRAVCLAFARAGADVVIGWHAEEEAAVTLARAVERLGRRAFARQLDVTDVKSVTSMFDAAAEALAPIDVLVNNAGIQQSKPIIELSVEEFDRMLAVHLRGAFLCSQAFTKARLGFGGGGRIINLCSQLGYIGRANYTAYSTAKGGMISFTRALAKELAEYDILVNGVAPGLVDTGFDPLSDEAKREHAASLPLRRLGTVEDMTSAFVFLASDEGRYYCGQLLHPNGGEIMP